MKISCNSLSSTVIKELSTSNRCAPLILELQTIKDFQPEIDDWDKNFASLRLVYQNQAKSLSERSQTILANKEMMIELDNKNLSNSIFSVQKSPCFTTGIY